LFVYNRIAPIVEFPLQGLQGFSRFGRGIFHFEVGAVISPLVAEKFRGSSE
jgi:hypothetical protein